MLLCFFLWAAFRRGFFLGILAFNPAAHNRRRTVRFDTTIPDSFKAELMSADVAFLFCNDIQAIHLSVARVVLFFLPFPC